MGWAAIFQAIAQGITNFASTLSYIHENKHAAKETAEAAQTQAEQRAKKAKYDMQRQKSSFLKGGVYFDGTPTAVIDETYNTAMEDINAISKDSYNAQKRLIRAGKTAMLTFLIDPAGNNGAQYAQNIAGAFSNKSTTSSEKVSYGKDASGSTIGTTKSGKIYASNSSGLA